jgi:transposase InsO family protein
MLAREGIKVIRLPPRSPNLNTYAERCVRSAKEECLPKMMPTGQGMLRRALREYLEHYHRQRNHQGIGNVMLMPLATETPHQGAVTRRQRRGGSLNYYDRTAA